MNNILLYRSGDRNQITLNLLMGKKFNNGIDVGGRTSVILDNIDVDNKYTLDFHNKPSPSFKGNVIHHNLEYGLPYPPNKTIMGFNYCK